MLFGVLLVVRVGVAGREPGCYKTEYGDSGKVADEKPTQACLSRHLSEMMDRIAKGPEDVKKSVRATDELP